MGAFQAGLILMRAEAYPKEIVSAERLVLAALFSFARDDDQPRAFPSAARVAERAGLSRRTVQRALDHLEELGAIVGEHRHRKPTVWMLSHHFLHGPRSAKESPPGDPATPPRRQGDAQQASPRRSTSVTMTHQCTEGRSRPKGGNRTDVAGDPSLGSSDRSASLATDSPRRAAKKTTAKTSATSETRPTGAKKSVAKKSVAKKAAKKAVRYEQDVLGIGEVYVAPMPPPPTQQEVERSRCPHGVVRGLYYQSQPNSDRLVCGDCDAVYPSHRRSVDPETWGAQVPGLLWYLHDNSIECTDSARSAMARTIGHAAFLDRFHIITVLTPDQKHTERLYVAWVAEQLEPGRVEQVLADALPHGGTRLYAVTSHPFEEQPRG